MKTASSSFTASRESKLASSRDGLSLQVKALSRLHELAMRLAGTTEPQPALEAVLETIVEAHTADFGLLSLYDPSLKCLTTAASIG
ncbi:MAG TPA: hypothetical protein VJ828_09760, partial [Lacipirellulaceae bacterium]|nr:hypothetical protein [Lacipirellulaceae bacterium]